MNKVVLLRPYKSVPQCELTTESSLAPLCGKSILATHAFDHTNLPVLTSDCATYIAQPYKHT